jgi:hypothetical protein
MAKSKRRRSPSGPGLTISQFAKEVGESQHVVRAAVRNGHIEAHDFNGRMRIPPRARARWRELWGEPETSVAAE